MSENPDFGGYVSDRTLAVSNYVISARRRLHACPELSECEFATSSAVEEYLLNLNLKYRKVHTGLIADVKGKKGDKLILLRADMDGLPVTERTGLPFAAKKNMHACGHDGHTAMLLGAAKLFSQIRPKNDVRLVFQFGEEGAGGAERMIEAGAADNADFAFALHLCPDYPLGSLYSASGPMFAGTVEFDVITEGRASHCADREKGKDALAAAVRFCNSAQGAAESYSRNTLLHIGALKAGSARNIVAGRAEISLTFRYFDDAHKEAVMMNVERLLTDTDKIFGTSHSILVRAVYPPLINSALAVKLMGEATGRLNECSPKYTAEDFAFFTRKTRACMAWLGTRDESRTSPLHSDTFDFDESALNVGVETFLRLSEI